MTIQISTRADGDVDVTTINTPNGNATVANRKGGRFAKEKADLHAGFAALADETAPMAERLQPAALFEAMRPAIDKTVAPPYRAMMSAVQAGKRADTERFAVLNSVRSDDPFAAEDRALFRTLNAGQRAAWLVGADRAQLAAILSAGRSRWSDIPDELWNVATERHATLAHLERTGALANFARQPTPDDPAPVGPDQEAAESATLAALQQARSEMAEIGQAEETLRRTIAAVAVAASLTVSDAHKLLIGVAA
ncbi:hypothetical protein [Sphingopyxis sp.]|jgi:hypothetical protein|uniref:hypothetical protein n=1 Tax=Sphingopyxis sp. TaxID=1908224 RepID=UPI003F70A70B